MNFHLQHFFVCSSSQNVDCLFGLKMWEDVWNSKNYEVVVVSFALVILFMFSKVGGDKDKEVLFEGAVVKQQGWGNAWINFPIFCF